MTENRRPDRIDLVASALLALEAAALLAVSVVYAIYAATGADVEVIPTLGIAAFALMMAAGVAVTARGFARGARWSRGAALTWQVLQAAAAAAMIGAVPWAAVAILLVSAAVAAAAMRASARDQAASSPEA